MNDPIQALSEFINQLDADTDHDVVAEARNRYDAVQARLDTVKAQLDAAMMAWIEANKRDVVMGETRYYVGPVKTVKCIDLKDATLTLLEMGGTPALVDCLSTGAFKPATTSEKLTELGDADAFARLFKTEVKMNLQTGKPLKRVHKTNDAFVK